MIIGAIIEDRRPRWIGGITTWNAALSANAIALEKGAVIGTNPASRLPGCEAVFVIDSRDGRIHAAPEAATDGALFRPNSRLIIIKEDPFCDLPRTYLLFEDGRFEVLQ